MLIKSFVILPIKATTAETNTARTYDVPRLQSKLSRRIARRLEPMSLISVIVIGYHRTCVPTTNVRVSSTHVLG